jgi:hypothetical protein
MKCPRCQSDLTEEEVRSLWGQLCRSKSSPLSKRKARERAKKAAAARWAAGAGRKKPRAKKGKALNEPSSATCGDDAPQRADCRTAGSQQRVGSRTPDKSRAPDADAARCGAGVGGDSKANAEGQTL